MGKIKLTVRDIAQAGIQVFDRDRLAADIEKDWVGRKRSNIGHQYVDLRNGKLVVEGGTWERKDFARAVLYLEDPRLTFYAWIDPTSDRSGWTMGTASAYQGETRITMRDEDQKLLERHVKEQMDPDLVERNLRFFREKPWEQLNGLTPEEGVAKLRELGFH